MRYLALALLLEEAVKIIEDQKQRMNINGVRWSEGHNFLARAKERLG